MKHQHHEGPKCTAASRVRATNNTLSIELHPQTMNAAQSRGGAHTNTGAKTKQTSSSTNLRTPNPTPPDLHNRLRDPLDDIQLAPRPPLHRRPQQQHPQRLRRPPMLADNLPHIQPRNPEPKRNQSSRLVGLDREMFCVVDEGSRDRQQERPHLDSLAAHRAIVCPAPKQVIDLEQDRAARRPATPRPAARKQIDAAPQTRSPNTLVSLLRDGLRSRLMR
jgi:hypothetical protein